MKIFRYLLFVLIQISYGCSLLAQKNKNNIHVTVGDRSNAKDTAIDNISLAAASIASETPFLTGYYYASSQNNTLTSFSSRVREISRRKATEYDGVDGSQPKSFAFPRFPGNARLALFFRNWANRSGDIFEYKLVNVEEKNGDTSTPWKQSNSVIVVPQLESGTNYMLMVRYIGEGNKISAYFFNTYAAWYPYYMFLKRNVIYFMMLFAS